ncbi:thiamine biosynthetic bifunctional enzyme like protein [Verticillium longisporum]|uniref:Thiamine biosynthetic bifunctional enzyme like protein n=1 Tax=Verticillium longisporum TaxID=100787 RepID=A0A8I3APE2_VERLO|nr:thiamine biosynthetic bifunctional enzyme like protein [Verticillium longisporum]
MVQYREKQADTGALVRTARALHAVTRRHGVPLLVNDRVDVALAVGCEGVHVGQDDMDLATARRLLGPAAIIGVTASTLDEARAAAAGGADYLGLGTVFATATKTNAKRIIGTAGLRAILDGLAREDTAAAAAVKTVCIGGIHAGNVQRVLYQSAAPAKALDGVAVVSAVVAAAYPEAASRSLLTLVRSPPPFTRGVLAAGSPGAASSAEAVLALVPGVIRAVAAQAPLSHNMTNLVVQNFAANVALAVGASPIMANFGDEAVDLAALGGALVVNMGTVTPEGLDNYAKALWAYNAVGQPVVFDPVGAGATAVRRAAVKALLAAGYLDIIKGNEGEVTTVLGEAPPQQQKGVDSSPSTLTAAAKASLVRRLAARERNVVLMTGAVDYVSDGTRTFAVANGHALLGAVTGTGCCLGTTVSAMVAAQRASGGDGDRLAAVVAGLLHYEIAAERAAVRDDVKGPGSFVPAFLDELARVRQMTVDGDLAWLAAAKVSLVDEA